MAYEMYLDGVLLPVTPEKLQLKIKNKNETIDLINENEVNILKAPGLTDIEFEMLIPQAQYPFAVYKNGFQDAEYYLAKLKLLKTSRKPFQFIVIRQSPSGKHLFDTNIKVSLEEYTITESAENGLDISVPIKLKEYRDYGTKIYNVAVSSEGSATVKVETPRPSKEIEKTYKIKSGDTLWNICKAQIGNGSKYSSIAKLNGIANPNKLTVGQVIRLG